jgi:foldase protein PrsA
LKKFGRISINKYRKVKKFMRNSIKGFILGVVFTAAISMIPAVADSVSKSINVLVDYVTVAVDGEVYDIPNFVHEGTTYVGLRAMGELIGYDVDWNDQTKVALFTSPGSQKVWPEPLADKTSLVINGKEIDEAEINDLYENFQKNYPNASKTEIKNAIVSEFAVKQFLDEKAEEYGIEVDMATIDETYKEYEKAFGDEFDTAIAEAGVTKEEFYQQYVTAQRYSMLTEAVVMYYVDSAANEEIAALKDKAKLEYDSSIDALTRDVVNVKHILIPATDASGKKLEGEALAEAKALADSIAGKLAKGEDFDKLLKEYNNDPGLTDEGYDVTLNSNFVAEFEAAALALKEGEISPVTETTYGYHILKAYSRETKAPEFDEYFKTNYLEDCADIVNNIYGKWLENANVKAEWSF